MNSEYGRFHRSTFCGHGECVEVAPLESGMIALRDSKDTSKQEHLYTRDEWIAFVLGVKSGEFDFGLPTELPSRSPSA